MDANTERMPGDAEAFAAAAGMTDLYGRRIEIGSEITWRLDEWPVGRCSKDRVCGWRAGRVIVDHGGELVEVEMDQILPF
jgi:hypothetical protein